ncbi:MAG: hypothetical protein ACP5IX_01590 [Patescibacteria group bacterium]
MFIFKVVRQNKCFIFTFISLICAISWFLNFQKWQLPIIYYLSFIIYAFINSILLGKILAKLLNLEKELQFFFGLFLLLFLLAFGMAMPIFFYKVTPIWLFGLLLFLTIIISLLNSLKYFESNTNIQITNKSREQQGCDLSLKELEDERGIKISKIFYFLFVICYLLALWFLFKSRTGSFILSPWEVIRPYYLYLWFGVALIAGLFIFSKEKIWKILLIIILTSLLLHSFLLVVYETGFGGDKWRHLGAERWLMEGKIYSPALFGEPIKWKQVGPIKIPEAFIVGNKNSYVNLWGLTIALSWLLKIDVFWIDLFLGYLFYSIFFPLLLFKFGQFFIRKKSFLLLLSFLPLCFSSFQIYGSITIPKTFGFLWFLFTLFFIFEAVIHKSNRGIFLAGIFTILLSYFNYILYFILIFEIIILSWLIRKIFSAKNKLSRISLIVLSVLFIILFLFSLPIADTAVKNTFKNWAEIKNIFGQKLLDFSQTLLFSKYISSQPPNREYFNWLFTQTNQNLNRAILLKLMPWDLILTPIICLLVIWGIIRSKRWENKEISILLFTLLFITLGNQFIAINFMEGNHIFNKRLVFFTAFLIMIFLDQGIFQLIRLKNFSQTAKIITAVLFLALLSTTTYASGPEMQTVTSDELTAAKYLWKKIKLSNLQGVQNQNYCVLGNTWPLLALEAESGGQIVAGSFPLYFEYRQPERVQLFENMNRNPSIRYLEKALEITGANECYFMTEEKWLYSFRKEEIFERLNKMLGSPEKIGDVYIWHYKATK